MCQNTFVRVLCGTAVLSSDRFHTYYEAAAKLRAILTQQMHRSLENENCDALIIPTVVFPPPKLLQDEQSSTTNESMFANDIMTVPVSLAGLPSISLPVPTWQGSSTSDSNWPDFLQPSLQVIAGRGNEAIILEVAEMIENMK
jgi:aspartyl-tRNA(Asn)/glutamyl-tRNA(Gln) amidotransferase subunit A